MSFEKLILLDKRQMMNKDLHHHRCSVMIGDEKQCEGKDQIYRAKHAYPSMALQFVDRLGR